MRLILFLAIILSGTLRANSQCDPAFTASVTPGHPSVLFQAVNSPGYTHTWSFGDAHFGNGATVNHIYNTPGVYTVKHNVYDSVNACSDSLTQTVNVSFTATCNASFVSTGDTLGQYRFISTSTSTNGQINNYTWLVNGVQVASSGNANSIVTSLPSGNNTVCLTINTVSNCSSTTCMTIVDSSSACNWTASFADSVAGVNPRQLFFIAYPNLARLQYTWNFGDGHTGGGRTPAHTYTTPGAYNICLVVRDSLNNCRDTVCRSIVVHGSAADSCTAAFTVSQNPSNPAVVTFTGTSNQTIVSQVWYISAPDSMYNATLYGINPTDTLTLSGYYTVCLRQTTNTGCVKMVCDTVLLNGFRVADNTIPSYPNPATGSDVNVSLALEQAARISITVYNTSGNIVYSAERMAAAGNNPVRIPVSNLQRGQYFIEIKHGSDRKRSIFQKL